ncbi:MAG: hypothetical protein WD512_20105 [Candidatus Paceibacterota bacterium]
MSSLKSNDNYYDTKILTGVALSGLLVKLFMGQNTSDGGDSGPANASIWGYGIVGASLLGLWFNTFYLVNKETMNKSMWQIISVIIALSMPVILALGSIAWLLSLNIIYKDRINKGLVSSDYTKFNGISTFLLILQLIITFSFLNDKNSSTQMSPSSASSKIYQIMSSQMALVSYLFAIINYVVLAIMLITLKYLSTDG